VSGLVGDPEPVVFPLLDFDAAKGTSAPMRSFENLPRRFAVRPTSRSARSGARPRSVASQTSSAYCSSPVEHDSKRASGSERGPQGVAGPCRARGAQRDQAVTRRGLSRPPGPARRPAAPPCSVLPPRVYTTKPSPVIRRLLGEPPRSHPRPDQPAMLLRDALPAVIIEPGQEIAYCRAYGSGRRRQPTAWGSSSVATADGGRIGRWSTDLQLLLHRATRS
jgi:hypothetical protein